MRDRVRALLPRLHVFPPLNERLDPWAEWLVRERFADLSAGEQQEMRAWLERTRDGVLDRGRVDEGDRVADVGAGTGLLTLGAATRVGADGEVVAIDVSADALGELRRLCTRANVAYLLGTADVLPLMDGSVDVVVTRSVLIYVREKEEAAREYFRVLAPNGRVSLYEPINRDATRLWDLVDFGDLRDDVAGEFGREWPADDPMLNFGADDLVRFFDAAGFADVTVERHDAAHEIRAEKMLSGVGAPGARSLSERWREAFPPHEVDELERRVRAAGTIATVVPGVFLSAVKR